MHEELRMRRLTSNPAFCFGGCLVLGLAGIALIGRFAGPRIGPTGPGGGPTIGVHPQAPKPFTSKEGKAGWSVVIPGGRALATPAVAGGKVFLGGGFGSHEFYGFDAQTGKELWLYQTSDDGPTAAVVEDGYVAFNTESCELEVLTTDGRRVWKKRLGDPLMSMPAIAGGKVYMAFPDEHRGNQHHLACFELSSGKEHWRQKITGEVITAPVIDGEFVYAATLEGTLHCFGRHDGQLAWREQKNATSSPAVCAGKVYFSRRVSAKNAGVRHGVEQKESIAWRDLSQGSYQELAFTARRADYLDAVLRKQLSGQEKAFLKMDSEVAFSTAPDAAKMEQAIGNLGQSTVAGVWSYQGSRSFAYRGKLYSAMGDTVHCADPATGEAVWSKSFAQNDNTPLVDAALTPPALANGKAFLGTRDGQVICLSAADGTELWRATVGEPIVFQPAVASGRVYVSTAMGRLFCIETGDEADHGWLMWGGSAAHNGASE
jgi:outer membrane protein assembly factor BamB